MASVNTSSIREEITHVKQQLDEQVRSGKVADETRMLFSTLLIIVDMLVAIFLEKNTKKGNKNSSIPSSQTDEDNSSKSRKPRGKQEEHEEPFANSRTEESVELSAVCRCEHCGENLRHVKVDDYERRTRIDIVFEKRIEHTDAEIKTCPSCECVNKGTFAADLAGPEQYGLGVKAFVLNLLVAQMVSFNRAQTLLKNLIGRAISQATMLKYILQLHEALAPWEDQAIKLLLDSAAMNVDETSMRVEKSKYWVHVYSAGDITLKRLHRRRGKEAIDEINIIPRYGGVIVHDCWPSYFSYEKSADALCGSHLMRELEFVINSNDYAWARNMKRLLKETCAEVSSRESKQLEADEYLNLQKRYRNILTRGSAELPARPVRPSGKRGRLAQSDAQNLWDRLKTHEQAVLLFAKKAEVPFTNNRAERDLRMGKVKQKVSGCFRQRKYAEAYCRISSYLQSMAYQGYNPLTAIQFALAGKFDLQKG